MKQFLQIASLPQDETSRHAGNTPYRSLDAWRGVAALWVVMLHVHLPTTPALVSAISRVGYLGVPMFFVISGYCIAHAAMRSLTQPSPIAHFVKARVRRIYPPYFFASLIAAALSLLLTVLIQHHLVKSSQIAELNLLHQNWRFYVGALTLTQIPLHTSLIIRVLWSLCYEVAFYVLVALFLFGMVRTRQASTLLDALSILTVGTLIWLNLAGTACPFPWNLWPQFGLGVLVYQILSQPKRSSPKWVFLLCSVLIALFALRHGGDSSVNGLSNGCQTLFYLGFAVVLLLLFRWDAALAGRWPVRLFAGVGMFSYSLYLIHLLALGIVTQGINRIHSLDTHPMLLYLIKLTVCVAVGKLFFQFGERPFLDTRQRQARQEAITHSPNVEPETGPAAS